MVEPDLQLRGRNGDESQYQMVECMMLLPLLSTHHNKEEE